MIPSIKKIAIVRANALGDFMFVLPAIRALRKKYPTAHIVLLGKPWHRVFVPGHVLDISRVVVVPQYPGVGAPETVPPSPRLAAFFAAMQAESFDIAFQMHGGGRYSNPFVAQLGAQLTVGSKTSDAKSLDISVPYVLYQNEILRYLELVSYIGAHTQDMQPEIIITKADLAEARQHAKMPGYLVLHPGASDPRRRWPAKQFAQVALHYSKRGLEVYITGIAEEQPIVDEIVKRTDGRAISMCGQLSLGGLAGLFSRARFVISNDTGPLHLARAAGCATVGIYWCGNFITAGPVRSTRHRSLLSWTVHCPECGHLNTRTTPFDSSCGHMVSFVADITVQQVIEAADILLRRNVRNIAD